MTRDEFSAAAKVVRRIKAAEAALAELQGAQKITLRMILSDGTPAQREVATELQEKIADACIDYFQERIDALAVELDSIGEASEQEAEQDPDPTPEPEPTPEPNEDGKEQGDGEVTE